jgi:hypothetical protein
MPQVPVAVLAKGTQLVVDDVLQGLAEQLAARLHFATTCQVVHDPDVREVELGSQDRPAASAWR